MPSNREFKSFNSFEEMDLDRVRNAASVDPIQGLRDTVVLILRVYSITREDLKKRTQPKRIIFTQTE